jgi:hypothetical protein
MVTSLVNLNQQLLDELKKLWKTMLKRVSYIISIAIVVNVFLILLFLLFVLGEMIIKFLN